MTISDANIVEQCLAGQKDVYAEIVRRYQHVVYNVSLSLMKNRDEADDLAQETFIQAFRKLASYDASYSFKNWILTICVNLGKNRFRAAARRRRTIETFVKEQANSAVSDAYNKDTVRDLNEGLKQIPEKLRTPLILKHVEGLSYEEVANILEISISAAKMRVKRGRERLVQILQSETEEIYIEG